MKKLKSILLSLLCFGMVVCASPLQALAEGDELADSETTGSSNINIQITPANVDITVPTEMKITYSANGKVTAPSSYRIWSDGETVVVLKTVKVTGNDGWELVNEKPTKANAKQIHLTINDVEQENNVFTLNKELSYKTPAYSSSKYSETYLSFAAEMPALYTENLSNEAAFTMLFTFGLNEIERTSN